MPEPHTGPDPLWFLPDTPEGQAIRTHFTDGSLGAAVFAWRVHLYAGELLVGERTEAGLIEVIETAARHPLPGAPRR